MDKLSEILSCIQQAYSHFGRPFTHAEYKEFAKQNGLIGYDYAIYHGRRTWRELLKLAGVPAAKTGRHPTRTLTKDDILDYIIQAAHIIGHFPIFKEYLLVAKERKFPSRVAVLQYGKWSVLRKEAQSKTLKNSG